MSHCYVSITRGASPIYSLGNVAECKGVLAGWHFGEQQEGFGFILDRRRLGCADVRRNLPRSPPLGYSQNCRTWERIARMIGATLAR
jgi:hypothetical protein